MRRPRTKKRADPKLKEKILADARKNNADRQLGYREQALALFPNVCGRCGREFSGKNLRELTVHHKDHDHMNNPPDGSNWELLCLYCHDNEHQEMPNSGHQSASTIERHAEAPLENNPFAVLKDKFDTEAEDTDNRDEGATE